MSEQQGFDPTKLEGEEQRAGDTEEFFDLSDKSPAEIFGLGAYLRNKLEVAYATDDEAYEEARHHFYERYLGGLHKLADEHPDRAVAVHREFIESGDPDRGYESACTIVQLLKTWPEEVVTLGLKLLGSDGYDVAYRFSEKFNSALQEGVADHIPFGVLRPIVRSQ